MARRLNRVSMWAAGMVVVFVVGGWGQTEEAETPIGPKWWPSRWGADDQRGAANRLTPDRVRKGA